MEILKKPVLTEKVTLLTDKLNKYVFLVDLKANKIQIREAVEKMYGVSVAAVNTLRYDGKRKARGTKRGFVSGRSPRFKKAVVSLASGDAIDFYGND
ncbi:large subunit ribosomal protein L23 [Anseongella ginsenosidimutans]|uniref:Large ribosomal subunit protein uL23 n=1 Tax=Anseongella ginsenosidimutans TaxID=496056 RepID=A0A4R3KPH4_9SPHI|nr:50S ribosomal protein L23 [Anseongella ginsenosidimutans]QEC54058.1 50S ribosomal protein L23 [Anseongella ginsenosidimutans]TCS85177.1 large subunit ribosomal protein L23 [Anseongella ginsenosidimutans]